MSKSGKKPVIKGFKSDKRVFQDASLTPTASSRLSACRKRSGLRGHVQPAFGERSGAESPVIGTMVFVDNIERLHVEPERVISIHSLNPDHLTTVAEIKASLGRK